MVGRWDYVEVLAGAYYWMPGSVAADDDVVVAFSVVDVHKEACLALLWHDFWVLFHHEELFHPVELYRL